MFAQYVCCISTNTWTLAGICLLLYLLKKYWQQLYFVRMGIPGPTPIPVIGSVYLFKDGFTSPQIDLHKKYGSIVGLNMFGANYLLVNDVKFLQKVMISSFSSFANHGPDSPLTDDNIAAYSLLCLRDSAWKDSRSIFTPAFSGSKLKQMTPIIKECCSQLVKHLETLQKGGKIINCKEVFGAYTMDVIAATFFGLQLDSQKNPDDPFVKNAKEVLRTSAFSFRFIIGSLFPSLRILFDRIDYGVYPRKVKKFFYDVIETVVNARKTGQSKERTDILQLMINAHKAGDEEINVKENQHQNGEISPSVMKKRKVLTTPVITSNAFIFFTAGYETTNTALGFVSYILAMHQDVQDKVIAEMDNVAPKGEPVTYELMSQMTYLDQVIKETLRIYPPIVLTDREIGEDVVVDGVVLKKNCVIFVPIYGIHHSPQLWENPEVFSPERFNKENSEKFHPLSWMPFGAGPRTCIGMRLALMEMKLALIHILRKFRFETCSETEIPPVLGKASGMISPPNSIKLKIILR